jgi:hypothetical protein
VGNFAVEYGTYTCVHYDGDEIDFRHVPKTLFAGKWPNNICPVAHRATSQAKELTINKVTSK